MKTLRVTVQIDIINPPERFSEARVEDFVDEWLHRHVPEIPSGGSVDWWFLRVEKADPGDVDNPEWEVLR